MLRHKTTEVRHTHLHIHIDIRHTLEPWFTWRWRGCDLPTRGSLLLFTSSIMGITLACKLPLHEKACLTRLAQNTRKFKSQISDHKTHKNHKAPIQIIRLTKITRPPWIIRNRTHKRSENALRSHIASWVGFSKKLISWPSARRRKARTRSMSATHTEGCYIYSKLSLSHTYHSRDDAQSTSVGNNHAMDWCRHTHVSA